MCHGCYNYTLSQQQWTLFQFPLENHTVSLENRGGVILKRKNTCSRTNTPGVAKEGPYEIREHHLRLRFM